MQQVTVWRCRYRETSSNRCTGIAVVEDGRTNHLHCSDLLFAKFNVICFSFPDGAKLLCPGQGMVPCFWMLLKPWWVFPNSGAPSALEQVEPLGLIFPTASVLGVHMPNITCLCCHQSLQEKLVSCWGGNAWTGAFYIPMTHSTWPLWKFSRWEQHVLITHKDSLHPAVAFEGQLLGGHWPASLAGEWLVVKLDAVLAEERQCVGWVLPDGEGGVQHLGKMILFFCLQENSQFILWDLWKCLWLPTYCRIAGFVHLMVSALECRWWSRSIWEVWFLF